jgi:hypothetical protein
MSRGGGWGSWWGLFVDRVQLFWLLSWFSRSLLWGWDPERALGSLACVFSVLSATREGDRVGAYKAGWEGGRWGPRRARLGEVMALRDAPGRWPGWPRQTMTAAARGVGADLGPGIVGLYITGKHACDALEMSTGSCPRPLSIFSWKRLSGPILYILE